MAFPLDSTPRSSAGVTVAVPDLMAPSLSLETERDWGGILRNNFLTGERLTDGITFNVPSEMLDVYTALLPTRRWGGIGTTVLDAGDGWSIVT